MEKILTTFQMDPELKDKSKLVSRVSGKLLGEFYNDAIRKHCDEILDKDEQVSILVERLKSNEI